MLTKSEFISLISSQKVLILDGGLATECARRGYDLNSKLWSAKLLASNPDVLKAVHKAYYEAGADIAITASYQASVVGLKEGLGIDDSAAVRLVEESVSLARQAATEVPSKKKLLVAGSIGPYGAYLANGAEYTGAYSLSESEFRRFHSGRMDALIRAGVHVLALETMPSLAEIKVVLELVRETRAIAWVGCSLCEAGHLADGTPLKEVYEVVERYDDCVVAFGVNCVPVQMVNLTLTQLNTPGIGTLPWVVYPNSGEIWDPEKKEWKGPRPVGGRLANQARKWYTSGARLIGGCCRTGPQDIEDIVKALEHAKIL
ncbi:homocysteine S-methyltransferase [Piedraia hortae CBS 480.64]|uniref:Homocysteine S-methyltransferase n=1 Tax=Piedraia hortae CBS 480.64 TaxID=1314780 RepID=A0A6A7C814_9PEZI|nr:homocysteine S-methyltransferase [Piedraia hortae CBS 480.64]